MNWKGSNDEMLKKAKEGKFDLKLAQISAGAALGQSDQIGVEIQDIDQISAEEYARLCAFAGAYIGSVYPASDFFKQLVELTSIEIYDINAHGAEAQLNAGMEAISVSIGNINETLAGLDYSYRTSVNSERSKKYWIYTEQVVGDQGYTLLNTDTSFKLLNIQNEEKTKDYSKLKLAKYSVDIK